MTQTDWQPIETAPDEGYFLGFGKQGYHVADADNSYFDDILEEMNYFNGDVYLVHTHWMPLPPAPIDSSESQR